MDMTIPQTDKTNLMDEPNGITKVVPGPAPRPAQEICWYSFWHLLILDNPVRLFFQNPDKILAGHIRPGMTVLDIGCGPGNFTRTMRRMAGEEGRVIAIDLQEDMLRHARAKCNDDLRGAPVIWHRCSTGSLNLATRADFALSFYMVHEVPDQDRLAGEVFSLLNPGGRWLVVEPVFHVTEEAFVQTLETVVRAGFSIEDRPALPMSRAVVLSKP